MIHMQIQKGMYRVNIVDNDEKENCAPYFRQINTPQNSKPKKKKRKILVDISNQFQTNSNSCFSKNLRF